MSIIKSIFRFIFNKELIEKAEKNPDINGCGSYSIQVKFDKFNLTDFDKCCNEHDICYEYCNTTKSECDQRFDSCLQEVCFEKKIERDWGFLMSKGISPTFYDFKILNRLF